MNEIKRSCLNCNNCKVEDFNKVSCKEMNDNWVTIRKDGECENWEERTKDFKLEYSFRKELKELYETYQKYLHVSDRRRIDIGLATCITREIQGTKIWLIFIGNSGDWKTVQIQAMDDSHVDDGKRVYETTRILKNFTSKTLVNGNKTVPDLAPKLKDKLILIPEMAQLLKLHPMEKAEVWAQLRDLYDGIAGKDSGLGKNAYYEDLNITFIGGSTPAIDSQILIHQDLGSRELVWRTSTNDLMDEKEIMDKCWDNENYEEEMKKNLNEVTKNFINTIKYNKEIKISEDVKKKLMIFSNYLRYMRAPAEIDQSGELINPPHPEKPTRILKQLKRLYIALKSLDNNYSDELALSTLKYLVESSSFQIRKKIFDYLLVHPNEEFTLSKIADEMFIGKKTSYRELNILWAMKFVTRRIVVTDFYGKENERQFWKLNMNNPIVTGFKDLEVKE